MFLLVEYSKLFDAKESLNELLQGIPKKIILKASPTFLLTDLLDNNPLTPDYFFKVWFSNNNHKYAVELYKRFEQSYGGNFDKIYIASPITFLKLLQYGFSLPNINFEKSQEQIEIDLFKALIIINESITKQQNEGTSFIEEFYPDIKLQLLLLSQSLASSDLTNFHLGKEFLCQSIKGLYFFKFITKLDQTKTHLNHFYKKYKVSSPKEYFYKIGSLIKIISTKEKKGFIEIIISENDPLYKEHIETLILFSNQTYVKEDEVDFISIRKHPLVRTGENSFRITHPIFLTDKMFKTLFFDFAHINQELLGTELGLKNFRSFYTTEFSEKFLFNTLIKEFIGKKYFQLDGDYFNSKAIDGAPDYYVRNGKYIFLFENKDVLLNANAKENSNFQVIHEELTKKFHSDKGKGKAIIQIAKNSYMSIKGENSFDRNYKPHKVIIYPILVVHDICYDCLGLNTFLNHIFRKELRNLGIDDSEMLRIKPLAVLHIDLFIFMQTPLKLGFETIISILDRFYSIFLVNGNRIVRSLSELEDKIINSQLPASKILLDYMLDKYPENINPIPLFESLSKELGID